jgi:diacylglycerol kinase (ATP)
MIVEQQAGYITYILNPKSGASSSKLFVREFLAWLVQKGFIVKAIRTKSLIHARELAAAAGGDANCSCIVAAGGDGTIREVAQGMKGSGKPLLIVSAGTENLLGSELGFDDRLATLIKAFEDGVIHDLDLGLVNGSCFTSIAGIGFDGDIVRRVNAQRSGHIHHFDYIWPIWRVFCNARFPVMRIEADENEIFQGPCMAFVGNLSRYAIGLQILSLANYGDGLLDVCVYRCDSKPHLVKHSLMTVFKRHAVGPDVVYRQAKHVRITSIDDDVATEIDGDPGPGLPLDISIIPRAVRIIVPRGAKPAGMRTRLKRMLG